MNKVIITGITGMDGTNISSYLLKKDFKVYGIVRQSATPNYWRLEEEEILNHPNLELIISDITDCSNIFKLVNNIKPDWIINLAAMSEVGTSFDIPIMTVEVDGLAPIYFLEAIRQFSSKTKYYQASSSEIIANNNENVLANEQTPLTPESPYAAAKLLAHNMVNIYKKSYKIFACSSILYNHSGKYRGSYFIESKIGEYVAKLKLGINSDYLYLGNLNVSRDIGHSCDYMKAVYLMMMRDKPENYIIATGKTYSIRQMLDIAFNYIGEDWRNYIKQDKKLFRPNEVYHLLGDASKAQQELSWKPKYNFNDVIYEIIDANIERLNKSKEKIYA